jgi:hypothetical protein
MSLGKGFRKAVVMLALALAATGALVWKIVTGLIPDRLSKLPEASKERRSGGTAGITAERAEHKSYSEHMRIALDISGAPRSLALSPSGSIWVAGGSELVELAVDGTGRAGFAMPAPVSAVTVDDNGEIFAAMSNRIEVRDFRGALLRSFADLDAGARIVSIAADPAADELFLADSGNAVVLRYTKAGKLLGRIGEKDERRGIPGFVVPSPYFSIAVSADHLLYAANPGRHGIEIYSYDGSLVGSFYKPSMGIDGFAGCCNPACIVLLDGGRVLTVEKGIKRIKIVSPAGELLEVIADEESLAVNFLGDGAVVGRDGRLLVLDRAAREIIVFQGKKT